MTILSIKRDWGAGAQIVRLVTTDRISDIFRYGWLALQETQIEEVNNGKFEWYQNDTVLISYPTTLGSQDLYNGAIQRQDVDVSNYSSQLFSVSTDLTSVLPTPLIYPHFFGVDPKVGGGQIGATQLIYGVNKIITVLNAGDSVVLPIDVEGFTCVVQNLGSFAVNVFPYPGSSINSLAANAPFSMPAGSRAQFIGMSLFNWATWLSP